MPYKPELANRVEKRFQFVDNSFLEYLEANFIQKVFSENEFSQTLYFDTDPPSLPSGLKLKARRYTSKNNVQINNRDNFMYEVKTEQGETNQKIRELPMPLSEIITKINNDHPGYFNIMPRAATFYRRVNYLNEKSGDIKITIDFQAQLFAVRESGTEFELVLLEQEAFNRVEFKYGVDNKTFTTKIPEMIRNFKLEPAEQKHHKVFRLIKDYYESNQKSL